MPKRIAYKTIGCKLNFAETSTIVRDFEQNGFEVVDFGERADVYLINTCTVTANADKDCRKSVRQAIRSNPDAYVAMVGCYSQLHKDDAETIPGVSIILGNEDKYNLFEHYSNSDENSIDYHGNVEKQDNFHSSYSVAARYSILNEQATLNDLPLHEQLFSIKYNCYSKTIIDVTVGRKCVCCQCRLRLPRRTTSRSASSPRAPIHLFSNDGSWTIWAMAAKERK